MTVLTDGDWIGDLTVFHGEGAYWDASSGLLRYVDMLAGDLVAVGEAGSERHTIGTVAALVRRRRAGGFVVATEGGFSVLNDALEVERSIPVFEHSTIRMNEGACDAAGRLYCGSMAYDYEPGAGTLYRLDPDLTVHVALEHVTIPNGLVWMDGDTRALHADTGDGVVWAYDFDLERGTFGDRRVHIDFAGTGGLPDGMALDAEGSLWVAMWGGGEVRRFDATGAQSGAVRVPVTNVTSCSFGGPGGTTLFITTSKQGVDVASEPHAGEVFVVDVGVTGAPVHAFGG